MMSRDRLIELEPITSEQSLADEQTDDNRSPKVDWSKMPPFRVFVLGAGFSAPAGLPLGKDLLGLVRKEVRQDCGVENQFEEDLYSYRVYLQRTTGRKPRDESIQLEDFIGFLDIQCTLGLTEDSSEVSLHLCRNYMSKILYESQTRMAPNKAGLYLDFASRLSRHDIVLTFNYDTILEDSLDRIGRMYKFSILPEPEDKDSGPEVTILKLHGSIDWFDDSDHLRDIKLNGTLGLCHKNSRSFVFNNQDALRIEPLIQQRTGDDKAFANYWRCKDPGFYFARKLGGGESPLLLTPSTQKLLNLGELSLLWTRLPEMGLMRTRLAIIGYSLPAHDQYAKQMLWRLVSTYQTRTNCLPGRPRQNLQIVQKHDGPSAVKRVTRTYRFAKRNVTDFDMDGFRPEILDRLF